ncbi:MAG: hypothetical protein ACPG8W_17840 [Candidatus Promineifilaceae bacterium]
MSALLAYQPFLKGLPTQVQKYLSDQLKLQVQQPVRWLLQLYDQDKRVHYEVSRIARRGDFELGLHFESRHKPLNAHMLQGFSRNLFEIHEQLGESIVAEQWDRGWTKVYEVYPKAPLTEAYQEEMGKRIAEIITCLHPILLELYERPIGRNR